MPTGNVSVRLSIQDAETVRAALEKLGSDGQAALKKIEAASTKPSAGLSAVDKTVADLKSRVEGSASSLGVLGTFLTGLGPIGLAAGAAIAVVVGAIYEMSRAAGELGERASQLKDFAEATGTTTTQVQALTSEASKFGIGGEQLGVGLQHLASNLDQARHGTGALYTELHRINPELAHQVASAKDVATAYDLIGRAIANAHDRGAAAGIAQAAFGRNAAQQGLLAADVYRSGGVAALGSGFDQAGKALDSGLITRLAALQSQIKQVEQENKDLSSSWFAESVLQRTLSLDQALQQSLLHMQQMAAVAKDESWGDWFKNAFAKMGLGAVAETGGDAFGLGEQLDKDRLDKWAQGPGFAEARKRLAAQMGGDGGVKSDQISDFVNQSFGALANPSKSHMGDWSKTLTASDEALKALEKHIKALGAAATPAEKLELEIGKLNNALAHGNITQAEYNRSLETFKNAQTEAATAARERLGIASQEEIYAAGLIKLQQDRANGYIQTDAQMAAAEERLRLASEKSFKQEQVKNSALPTLTKMGQGDDFASTFDKLASGQLEKADDLIVKIANHTGNARDNMRQFGVEAITAMEQAIVKATILAPLARMISGGMGLPFGGGGGGNAWGFAEGGIMSARGPLPLRRYAGGGIATGPQMAIFGEGGDNEAFVPLPNGNAIPVQINGKGGGGGNLIHTPISVHINAPPSSSPQDAQRQARRMAGAFHDAVSQIVDERVVRHLQPGGMLNQMT